MNKKACVYIIHNHTHTPDTHIQTLTLSLIHLTTHTMQQTVLATGQAFCMTGLNEYLYGNRNAGSARGAAGARWQITLQTDLLALQPSVPF